MYPNTGLSPKACMNVDIPEKLKPYVNDYKINLVEVAFVDDKLDNFHSDFRIIAEYFVNTRKNADYIPSPQEILRVDEFLKLLQFLTIMKPARPL